MKCIQLTYIETVIPNVLRVHLYVDIITNFALKLNIYLQDYAATRYF